ncbi:MAG: hypothetical protein V2J07_10800 [Anaerolineae bacterium]|jgi:hypothetical protein|nr:hypothetical protein [Anaerolineae bacterium]
MITNPVENTSEKPESWTATFTALILFLFLGLTFVIMEIPHTWTIPILLREIISVLLSGQLFLYPTLLCIGWIKGFPRWAYPYLGIVLLLSILLMNASTPGFLFGDELWGWRAWIPLLIISAVALLVTRSIQPLRKFFTNIKEDWTLLTFGLFGCLPVYAVINFDEMDRLYSLYFMVFLTVVMLSTVTLYMRSCTQRQRIITLLIGVILTIMIAKLGPVWYWQNSWTLKNWYRDDIFQMVVLIMFSPALIGIFNETAKWVKRRSKKPLS